MARTAHIYGMTIAQLEREIDKRRGVLAELNRERAKLQKRLDALDRKIMAMDGSKSSRAGSGGGRTRNDQSLVQTMKMVLSKAGKPMRVGDIMESVLSSGYRTGSMNFRGIVNQTLIKEKQFGSAGRGLYQLKK